MVFNPKLRGAFVFVPGVMAMVLLLVWAMMASVTIAREKEVGTIEILLVSPLTQAQILFGKIVPYLLLSFLNGCLIIALGVFLLHIPMNGSLLLLLAETLLFILLALSIGLLISSLVDSQLVAMFSSLIIMLMPTIFLSGFIFPIESMPRPLQVVSNIIPAKYFINIVKGIMVNGAGLGSLWRDTAVLVGMALTFIGLTLRLKTETGLTMRRIRFLIKKEFKQIFRNAVLLRMMIAAPVLQLILLSYAANFEVKNLTIAVVDQDHSTFSQRLVSKFRYIDNFQFLGYLPTEKQARQQLLNGIADLVLAVPPHFERDLYRNTNGPVAATV